MSDEEVTTRHCRCDDRYRSATFRLDARRGGWVFIDMPTRTMSRAAVFFAFFDRSEYKHEDHRGEPVLFLDCPFCGEVLPGVSENGPATQADGEGPEGL
jgi:hypothetical protein